MYLVQGDTKVRHALWGWVHIDSHAAVLSQCAFGIIYGSVIMFIVLSRSRAPWRWYYVLVISVLELSGFLPMFLITPINGTQPVLHVMPPLLRYVFLLFMLPLLALNWIWLYMRRADHLGLHVPSRSNIEVAESTADDAEP